MIFQIFHLKVIFIYILMKMVSRYVHKKNTNIEPNKDELLKFIENIISKNKI